MNRCDYTWYAPYQHAPPDKRVTSLKQKCSLEKGHEGPHRSLANVIKEQAKEN